ncbi:hypothetical protein ACFGVS_29440 [Mucilaginibacter sp. AW1-7]|jgi:hypothetical protein|uniref:hypothetical protein n=1 Tax=unclassified Mucilaginibacter TaxID=2617802 RepID=UPI0008CC6034|nr:MULTISPECIES: hypothetical protein [unclassified Mucilaginibacter]WDF75897.1 hypothetical protein PQ469_18575 [Mucilaginibacter sp. KACC 22773]SEO63608.1 hypothetical protein SAMN05428947_103210 [Mucilaginibacter sp. OK283]
MKHHKQLERRTFLQDRFDILIKRQKNGTATFNELTELDDIVNRDPAIRESILVEMQEGDAPDDHALPVEKAAIEPVKKQGLLDLIRGFINRWFVTEPVGMKTVLI